MWAGGEVGMEWVSEVPCSKARCTSQQVVMAQTTALIKPPTTPAKHHSTRFAFRSGQAAVDEVGLTQHTAAQTNGCEGLAGSQAGHPSIRHKVAVAQIQPRKAAGDR